MGYFRKCLLKVKRRITSMLNPLSMPSLQNPGLFKNYEKKIRKRYFKRKVKAIAHHCGVTDNKQKHVAYLIVLDSNKTLIKATKEKNYIGTYLSFHKNTF